MPRPAPDSRLRRFLMQGIMWMILVATVSAAALVNHVRRRSLAVELDEPTAFDDFSLRLPRDWARAAVADDPEALVELQETGFDEWGRTLAVVLRRPSPTAIIRQLLEGGRPSVQMKNQTIPFGDADGLLTVRRQALAELPGGGVYMKEVAASRPLPSGDMLSVRLTGITQGQAKELDRDIDLVKRIAASLRVRADQ